MAATCPRERAKPAILRFRRLKPFPARPADIGPTRKEVSACPHCERRSAVCRTIPLRKICASSTKTLARPKALRLATAQRRLARRIWRYRTWADLLRAADGSASAEADGGSERSFPGRWTSRRGPGARAASSGRARQWTQQTKSTRRCGMPAPPMRPRNNASPWSGCCSMQAPRRARNARAEQQRCTPPRAKGPLALVELLIRGGAVVLADRPARQVGARLRPRGNGERARRNRRTARPAGDARTEFPRRRARNSYRRCRWLVPPAGSASGSAARVPSSPTAIRGTISAIPSCSGSSPTIRP